MKLYVNSLLISNQTYIGPWVCTDRLDPIYETLGINGFIITQNVIYKVKPAQGAKVFDKSSCKSADTVDETN